MFLMPNEGWAAILGAAVSALITYKFAVDLSDRQFEHLKTVAKLDAWHTAAREFIAAFADEIGVLDSAPTMDSDVADLLRDAHRRHARAVAAFEPFVPESSRANFSKDWKEHCYGKPGADWPEHEYKSSLEQDDLLYLHYSTSAAPRHVESPRLRAATRLKTLLGYAKDA